MTIPEKKIIIRLPSFTWKSFINLRNAILFLAFVLSSFLSYWYHSIRPYLWISSAHVNGYSSTITADRNGTLFEMVSEGDQVKKGQVLFSFENGMNRIKQKQTQASIDTLNALMRSEKLRMEKAMQDYLAASAELDLGIGSQEMIENHLSRFQEAQAKSEDAAAQINQLNQEISLLDDSGCKVQAPFDSIVLKKSKNLGEMVVPGEHIYSLLDPNQVWVEAEVPEKELNRVHIGTPAKVRLAAYPGKEWIGKVSWISPATVSKIHSLPNRQNETIAVKIALEDKELFLKPGLSAEVCLKVR